MKLAAALLAVLIVSTGCNLDSVMGRDATYTPTTTKAQKLDCDLIFPPASVLP